MLHQRGIRTEGWIETRRNFGFSEKSDGNGVIDQSLRTVLNERKTRRSWVIVGLGRLSKLVSRKDLAVWKRLARRILGRQPPQEALS